MKYSWLIGINLLFALGTYAQDNNYWTQQFGSRTALLSGAVVGGSDDNTMVYYNPGALGFQDNASISVNATAYHIENIRIFNALGQEADFKSNKFASIPLMVGGMLKTKKDRWKIGYAIMTPGDFNFKGIARVDGAYDIAEETESPGKEEVVGESGITTKLSEVILGVGIGRALNERWAVGITQLFTMRSQTYQRNLTTHIFLNDGNETQVSGILSQNVDYYNLRYALKLGLNYRAPSWSWGLTLTSPSLRLMGNGTVASDITAYHVKLNGTDRTDGVASDRQDKLKTKYKSPFTVATGVNFIMGRSTLGLVVQYYTGIGIYDVMQATPSAFVRPAEMYENLGSDKFLRVKSAALPVFNVALGYEYKLNEKIALLGSIRNDMSYYDHDLYEARGIKTTISNWDIYHFVAGTTINHERSSIDVGLLVSAGKNDAYQQEGYLGNLTENDLLQGSITVTKANYFSVGLLIGYTFNFKKF